jgi:hypothetical protein
MPVQDRTIKVPLLISPVQIPDPSKVKIPVINNAARWIVELKDIPREEEPENARYVSERPSRVDEEVQAEHTSREPRLASMRERTGASNTIASAAPPRLNPRPETPPAGIQENTHGNPPAPQETGNMPPKPYQGSKLFPTLGELAQNGPNNRPGHAGIPGVNAGDGENGEGNVPGIPQAPENFLPLVKKRGPVTLLNAKSYTYSGFVRRVAYRIFDRFVMGFNPRQFEGSDWTDMQKGAVFETIMNTNGRLMNIYERRSSGSEEFDSLVRSSVQKGSWDTNVPDGAECADGFVHFMFIPKILPSEPATVSNGSRIYTSFYLLAVAGLKECE